MWNIMKNETEEEEEVIDNKIWKNEEEMVKIMKK